MKSTNNELSTLYSKIDRDISKRLMEFENIYKKRDLNAITHEMLFCILTPQSKAKVCWSCLNDMIENEDIHTVTKNSIKQYIGPVRFYNNKTQYMYELIGKINSGKMNIEHILFGGNDVMQIRDMLVKEIKGYGYKESSHFLRNIGLGEDIAILDRHILRNLLLYGIIPAIPSYMNRNRYISIEEKMRRFADGLGIPMAHLDILLWYKETGEIFK